MKKIFLFLSICFSLPAFSQQQFGYYTILSNKYDITIPAAEKGKFTLHIDISSLDDLYKKVGLLVDEKDYDVFISSMEQAKGKYIDWAKTAKDNNVTDVSKDMGIPLELSTYFKYGSEWCFNFRKPIGLKFRVFTFQDKVHYTLTVRTGELKSSDNEFMRVDGGTISFYSLKEINAFLDVISKQKIIDYTDKPKAADLFKN